MLRSESGCEPKPESGRAFVGSSWAAGLRDGQSAARDTDRRSPSVSISTSARERSSSSGAAATPSRKTCWNRSCPANSTSRLSARCRKKVRSVSPTDCAIPVAVVCSNPRLTSRSSAAACSRSRAPGCYRTIRLDRFCDRGRAAQRGREVTGLARSHASATTLGEDSDLQLWINAVSEFGAAQTKAEKH